MNRSEIVKQYVAEHPTPIQDNCPQCIQYWNTVKGEMTWDNQSGVRSLGSISHSDWGKDYFICTPTRYYFGFYANYEEKLEMLEVAQIKLAVGGRGIDGCPVDWEYLGKRMFTFKGDPDAYDLYGNHIKGGRFYSKEFKKLIHETSLHGFHCKPSALAKIVTSLDPEYEKERTSYPSYVFEGWYTKRWVSRKVNQRIKTIFDFELDTPSFDNMGSGVHIAIVHQVLDENYSVLRTFYQHCDTGYSWATRSHTYAYSDEWEEQYRLFIDKKGKCTLIQYNRWTGIWEITNREITRYYGEKKEKGTRLLGDPLERCEAIKYVKDIIDWQNDRQPVITLMNIIRHPIVEQLIKAGYPLLAKQICGNNQIAAALKHNFLVDKERKLPIYKLLGVNKYILKAAEELGSEGLYAIRNVKCLYSKEDNSDISYLDERRARTLIFALTHMDIYDLKELFGVTTGYWRDRHNATPFNLDDEQKKFLEKLIRLNAKGGGTNVFKVFLDVNDMFKFMPRDRRPNVDIRSFNSVEDLMGLHDDLVEIKNQIELERRAMYNAAEAERLKKIQEKFESLQEDRIKKYECNGDKYCIRVPHKLSEITNEGVVLGHCVGGYVNRHALGDTNIMFLRKMGDENTPFYTIEVNNNGTVVQIHGSHNKWLGNDPDAIPFVYEWIKSRGFACDNIILLGLGNSYSCGDNFLDESYLTRS